MPAVFLSISKFSDLKGNKIVSLDISFEGGKLEVENSSSITGKSRFSNLSISHLDKKIDLNIQYGNCEVNQVAADFTLININNKYGDVKVDIPSEASYILDAELKFCDLDYPDDRAEFTQKITTNTSKSFKATIGKKQNPKSNVIVRSEFGNVSLE